MTNEANATMIDPTTGWWADDGYYPVHYPNAISAEEAAEEYFSSASYDDVEEPEIIAIRSYRIVLDEDGDEIKEDEESFYFTLMPPEPKCPSTHDGEHEWVRLETQGSVVRYFCIHCCQIRVVDTWYRDERTGQVFPEDAVWYEDTSNEDTLAISKYIFEKAAEILQDLEDGETIIIKEQTGKPSFKWDDLVGEERISPSGFTAQALIEDAVEEIEERLEEAHILNHVLVSSDEDGEIDVTVTV